MQYSEVLHLVGKDNITVSRNTSNSHATISSSNLQVPIGTPDFHIRPVHRPCRVREKPDGGPMVIFGSDSWNDAGSLLASLG